MIILHIGTHKTGTTALQSQLQTLKTDLKQHKVIYPETGTQGAGHHQWPWALRDNKDAEFERMVSDLKSSYTNENHYILSSEEWSFLNQEKIEKIGRAFDFCEVKIVCYLRSRSDFLISEFKQHVSMPSQRYNGSLLSFLFEKKMLSRMNYAVMLSKWGNVFQTKNIYAGIYNKKAFVNNDILYDFFDLSGIYLNIEDSSPSKKENVSLSNEASAVLSKLNAIDMTDNQHITVLSLLRNLKSENEYKLLNEREWKALNEHYRYDDARLLEKFSFRKKDELFIQNGWQNKITN